MIISNKNQTENINISLSGQPVARASHHKYMSVYIDNDLFFDKHINKLCSKLSQSIRVKRRISKLLPVEVLRNLYYTLIYSRLIYAITPWGSVFNFATRRLESLITGAISVKTDQSNSNQVQISPNCIQCKDV